MKVARYGFLSMTILLTFVSIGIHAKVLNESNPDGYKQFRLSYAEMQEIANNNRLKHRIFYEKPSSGPDAAWFDAVKQGDLETVKKMVEKGQNIEVKDEASFGQTALGWATFIGYEDIVDYLLDQGADIMATDRADVPSALKSAGLGSNVNIFKKLYERLKDKIDINDREADTQGETVLFVAASNNRIEIVEFLLSIGADPNLPTTEKNKEHPVYNQNPLSIACTRGLVDMSELLIQHGAINLHTGKASCERTVDSDK